MESPIWEICNEKSGEWEGDGYEEDGKWLAFQIWTLTRAKFILSYLGYERIYTIRVCSVGLC